VGRTPRQLTKYPYMVRPPINRVILVWIELLISLLVTHI
jgi:hypothetical protein